MIRARSKTDSEASNLDGLDEALSAMQGFCRDFPGFMYHQASWPNVAQDPSREPFVTS